MVDSENRGVLAKFEQIKLAFSGFDLADVRMRPIQSFGELALGETRLLARLHQRFDHGLMLR